VVAAVELGLTDGVAPEVLAAWRSWRRSAGPDTAEWDATG
jgi:hypothetical protein